jgi:hypothetical protein
VPMPEEAELSGTSTRIRLIAVVSLLGLGACGSSNLADSSEFSGYPSAEVRAEIHSFTAQNVSDSQLADTVLQTLEFRSDCRKIVRLLTRYTQSVGVDGAHLSATFFSSDEWKQILPTFANSLAAGDRTDAISVARANCTGVPADGRHVGKGSPTLDRLLPAQ